MYIAGHVYIAGHSLSMVMVSRKTFCHFLSNGFFKKKNKYSGPDLHLGCVLYKYTRVLPD